MTVLLRKVVTGDMGWLVSVHGTSYAHEFGFNEQFEIDIARKMVALHDKTDDFFKIWIAEENGNKAGSIAISKISEKIAFVNFLLVLNNFRGKGIAKALMNQVIQHAKQNEIGIVRLETYSCLVHARELYKSCGFRIVETTKDLTKYGHTFNQEFWELTL